MDVRSLPSSDGYARSCAAHRRHPIHQEIVVAPALVLVLQDFVDGGEPGEEHLGVRSRVLVWVQLERHLAISLLNLLARRIPRDFEEVVEVVREAHRLDDVKNLRRRLGRT
jgi:hypothetical protein